jgi:cell division protein FtsI (penicillin-binding protein 3)
MDAGRVTDLSRRLSGQPVPGLRVHDQRQPRHGRSLNVPEILIHSSNIGTAHVVDDLGATRMKQVMADLGFNERPYIELPARGFPIWASGDWPRLRAMTVGYGHGIAVTPLHLASAYAAMVNGGIWRPATLLRVEPATPTAAAVSSRPAPARA